MQRPQSREFLHRSKIHIKNFKEAVTHSQTYQSMNSNRSYSNSQNRPTNVLITRNSVGGNLIQKSQTKPSTYSKNIQYTDQIARSPPLPHKNSITHHSLQKNKQNIPKSLNIPQLQKILTELSSITERVCVLESVQKFEQQKILFNAKKIVQQALQENNLIQNKKNCQYQQKTDRKYEQILKLRQQIQKLKVLKISQQNTKQAKIAVNFDNVIKQQVINLQKQIKKAYQNDLANIKEELSKKINGIQKNIQQSKIRTIKKDNTNTIALFQISAKLLSQKPIKTINNNNNRLTSITQRKQNSKQPSNQKDKIIQQIQETYKIDKDGFLMDQQGKYILDNRNYMIRIDEKMMKKLSDLGVITYKQNMK